MGLGEVVGSYEVRHSMCYLMSKQCHEWHTVLTTCLVKLSLILACPAQWWLGSRRMWVALSVSCDSEYKDVFGVEGQELLSHHRALRLTSLTLGIGRNTEQWIERQYVSPGLDDITFRWVWMGVSTLSFHRMNLTNQWKIIFHPFNVERGLATSFRRSRVTNPDNNTIRLVSMSQPSLFHCNALTNLWRIFDLAVNVGGGGDCDN